MFSMQRELFAPSYLHPNQTLHLIDPFSQQKENLKLWVKMAKELYGPKHSLTVLKKSHHCLRNWDSNHYKSDCWTWNDLSKSKHRNIFLLKRYKQKWKDISCRKLVSHYQQTYMLKTDSSQLADKMSVHPKSVFL